MAALKPYLRVRKVAVERALEYLVTSNDLYKRLRVRIDRDTLGEWNDECVPQCLLDSVILVPDSDSQEREDYIMELQEGNHENDFQDAIDLASDAIAADDAEIPAYWFRTYGPQQRAC